MKWFLRLMFLCGLLFLGIIFWGSHKYTEISKNEFPASLRVQYIKPHAWKETKEQYKYQYPYATQQRVQVITDGFYAKVSLRSGDYIRGMPRRFTITVYHALPGWEVHSVVSDDFTSARAYRGKSAKGVVVDIYAPSADIYIYFRRNTHYKGEFSTLGVESLDKSAIIVVASNVSYEGSRDE